MDGVSKKNGIVCLLLCFFLGCLGIHRFFVGKIGTGLLMLITLGGFGIWAMIDLIMIIVGKFTDSSGNIVKLSNSTSSEKDREEITMNHQRELWEAVKSEYLRQIEEALKTLGQPNTKEMLDDVGAHLERKYRDLTVEERCLEKFEKILTQMGPASDYVELLKTSSSESPARPQLPPDNGESHSSPIDEPDKASTEENSTAKRVGIPVFVPVTPPYDDQAMLRKAKWLGLGVLAAVGMIILIAVVMSQLKHQHRGAEITGSNIPIPTPPPITTPTVSPQAVVPVKQTTGGGGANNSLDLDLQTYIVRFTTASDINAITARELLTMFNAEQSPKIKTHHYKTELRENSLVGLLCVDGKSDLDATTQMLLSSNNLKLVSMEPATEDSLKKLYAMGQPSLIAKPPVPSAPAVALTPAPATPPAGNTSTTAPPMSFVPQAENPGTNTPPMPSTPPTENTNTANAIQKVHPPQSGQPIVFVTNPAVEGIMVGKSNCTARFVKSRLGAPKRIDSNGRMLKYTDDGIDFWFSQNGPLSEIHLNNGFQGRLDTEISFTSTRQDVFTAYGAPVATISTADLHRQNNERVLYVKDDTSRIYYGKCGLIFWFRNDRISQIVVFEGRMKNASTSSNRR